MKDFIQQGAELSPGGRYVNDSVHSFLLCRRNNSTGHATSREGACQSVWSSSFRGTRRSVSRSSDRASPIVVSGQLESTIGRTRKCYRVCLIMVSGRAAWVRERKKTTGNGQRVLSAENLPGNMTPVIQVVCPSSYGGYDSRHTRCISLVILEEAIGREIFLSLLAPQIGTNFL